jgi:hypothetical protein
MMDGIVKFLAPGIPEGSREWAVGSEGLPMGWAFLIFLVLAGACIWAYRKFAPEVKPRWRRVMTGLRLLAIALFLFLLVKPVLNLTVNEPVRQTLLVLLDASQSMQLTDRRTTPEDLKRAEVATGEKASGELSITRWDLLRKLAVNPRLNLWPRLQEKSDVMFYRFGRDAAPMGPLTAEKEATLEEARAVFEALNPDESATGLGEALRQVLDQNRGQAVSGVLVISDGASNSGLPPAEAARLTREANVPLFVYGVGVTSPIDLVMKEVSAPRLAFVRERVDVKAKFSVQGVGRQTVSAVLTANGEQVDEQKVDLAEDGDYEVNFRFDPQKVGDLVLSASIPVLPGEVGKDNNAAEAKLRVVDNKIKVLFIDQEPRWDFRYLLAYLQRDRRLETQCVLIDGEPGLDKLPDSPFLPGLPEDREGIFRYEIIILGDVNPADLGETRMKLISEWVEQSNGGIIFLAGPKFDPTAYGGTPLEALLPVVPDSSTSVEQRAERFKDPVPLKLTSLGESSPYLRLVEDPAENARIWAGFPGVRWVAPVTKAKPGAEVLLVDPSPERAGSAGGTPVIAVQGFGGGQSVFIGTDETYRWRSRTGEKYYSQVWGAIMQSLSLKRLEGASSRTQLKADRERYFVGDKVTIAGKIYKEGYEPLTVGTLQGKLKITGVDAKNAPVENTLPQDVTAAGDQPGEYRGQFTADVPGIYSYSTLDDPGAVVKFEVIEPKIEQMETALNERTLRGMADVAKGRFLREEDLGKLPDLVSEQSATVATFRKIDLFYSPWWLAALLLVLLLEWLLRRLMQLK